MEECEYFYIFTFALKIEHDIDLNVENLACFIQVSPWELTQKPQIPRTHQSCFDIIQKAISEKRKVRKIWINISPPQD